MDTRTTYITDLIRRRRSIGPKLFDEEKIPNDLVAELVENACWAPNHKKTEPWRYYVFADAGKVQLADFFAEAYDATFAGSEKFSEKKRGDLQKKVQRSSHVIAICMQRDPDERLPEWEELAAVSTGVQNLWLSATAHGLGGYWSSPGYLMEAFGSWQHLPAGQRCLGFFYLGVPRPGLELPG